MVVPTRKPVKLLLCCVTWLDSCPMASHHMPAFATLHASSSAAQSPNTEPLLIEVEEHHTP